MMRRLSGAPFWLLPCVAGLFLLSACEDLGSPSQTPKKEEATPATPPVMRWDHKTQAGKWTNASFAALAAHGQPLLKIVPKDIQNWCPAYPAMGPEGRKAFWTGLLSTLSKHESTWKETAVGGGGRWFGLVQIAPGTARGYGCKARSGAALKTGTSNLSCAIRIMAHTVPRDGVVSAGFRGVAADWGPFHSSRKREDMRSWVRNQDYCKVSKG